MSLTQLAGILPAIVFPTATLAQLLGIVRRRSTAGVCVSTWLLFGFANIAIYVYAERYAEWQAIVGMLLTAVFDFAIVALALIAFRESPTNGGAPRRDPASITVAAARCESRSRAAYPEFRPSPALHGSPAHPSPRSAFSR